MRVFTFILVIVEILAGEVAACFNLWGGAVGTWMIAVLVMVDEFVWAICTSKGK